MMRVIYHSVDDLGAVPGIEADEYESAERAFLCWTDEVFVTSKTLQKKLGGFMNKFITTPTLWIFSISEVSQG